MATIDPPTVTPSSPGISGFDAPEVRMVLDGNLRNIIGSMKPTNVEQLLQYLGNDRVNKMKSIIGFGSRDASGRYAQSYKDRSHSEFVDMLNSASLLKDYLNANKSTVGPSAAPVAPLIVNHAGLHLLLANPMIAKVVMEQRKKQAAAGLVRAVAVPSGIFGLPASSGIHISLSGGAMTDSMTELDNNVPIEMRGAGYALAAMRGGAIGGNMIIGNQGTTMWRPIDDNSFISHSLELAIDNLKSQLGSAATLDATTESTIRNTITELKAKEGEVKKYRDQITAYNSALAIGTAKASGDINIDMIKNTAEAYNNAMKSRQKIEGKLLRVVVALGGKVAAINV